MSKKPKNPKKQPTGDYPVGYCRPPVHTRIPKGKVLNPHGRNGTKVEEVDAFEKARRRLSRVTIDGETVMLPSDEAYWLRMMAGALGNDKTAARIVAEEFGARRRLGPAPATAEELAQEAAEQAERERLSAKIVAGLEELARIKKQGAPRVRFGAGGQQISDEEEGPSSAGAFDQPIEETG